jgi:pyruvate-formate lyase-activating enzyme
MKLKNIIDEDFINYKKPSMMLAMCYCDWKCLTEKNLDLSICQNSELAHQDNIEVSTISIVSRYLHNPITKAIVIAGLEPFLQIDEVIDFIRKLRIIAMNDDMVVIYTGYYPEEIQERIYQLKQYKNIIVKFGRYIPDNKPHYDKVLGVKLASDNQYAVKIS